MGIKEKHFRSPPLPQDIGERLKRLSEVMERHPMRLAYLFGSSVCSLSQGNDIDLAALPNEGVSYTAFYADIPLTLKTDRIDLVDLRFAPSYLVAEILTSGKCTYSRSELGRCQFEAGKKSQWIEGRSRAVKLLEEVRPIGLWREFIVNALSELERIVQELEKYQGTTANAMAANLSLRWTIERGLLSGLTILFHIAAFILANAFGRTVDTYEQLLTELCSFGVISDALYQQLRGVGGFRNVLVNECLQIDLNGVAKTLSKAPQVFRSFKDEMSQWLSQKEEG